MLVSITRLRIRRLMYLPVFQWNVFRAVRQAKRSTGYEGGRIFIDARRVYWTLTVWKDREAMLAYMTGSPHREMMPHLKHWCDEAATVHWEVSPSQQTPSWEEAHRRLIAGGKVVRVLHASADHANLSVAAPRPSTRFSELPVPPKKRNV